MFITADTEITIILQWKIYVLFPQKSCTSKVIWNEGEVFHAWFSNKVRERNVDLSEVTYGVEEANWLNDFKGISICQGLLYS